MQPESVAFPDPEPDASTPADRTLRGRYGSASASVLVIGAGPAGLAVTAQLGLRGLRATLVDALSLPGGQCRETYAERLVYDVPGAVGADGARLAQVLLAQALRFRPEMHMGSRVVGLVEENGGGFSARLSHGPTLFARTVVVAAGQGVFTARGFGLPGPDEAACVAAGLLHYEGEGCVPPEGSRMLVVGDDTEECCRWALLLSRRFAAEATVMVPQLPAAPEGFTVIQGRVIGIGYQPPHVEVAYRNLGSSEEVEVGVEDYHHVLALTGFRLDLTALRNWGFELSRDDGAIRIDPLSFETSWPGVFAIGDCVSYPGKRPYLTSAFHEAALAARAIHRFLLPGAPDPPYTADSTTLDAPEFP